MENELIPELQQFKDKLDELAISRGWSTLGYYFDDSPFEGVHLVQDGSCWKLSFKQSGKFAEQRFFNLQDACQAMLDAVTRLKLDESAAWMAGEAVPEIPDLQVFEEPEVDEPEPGEDEQAENATPISCGGCLMIVLPLLFSLIAFLLFFLR
jgi:hypothetical protein